VEPTNLVITAQSNDAMKITELVTFYLRAVERFRKHSQDLNDGPTVGGSSHAQGALGEALNWADTIDQYLRDGPHGTLGTNRDPDWAASVDGADGGLVRAFRYARNHVHHQWFNLVATRIYQGPQGQVTAWVWGKIPATTKGQGKSDPRRDDFDRQMLDADILSTLDRLAEVFWKRRRWEIQRSDIDQPEYPVRSTLTFDPERDNDAD
jgi:hypothetical protein